MLVLGSANSSIWSQTNSANCVLTDLSEGYKILKNRFVLDKDFVLKQYETLVVNKDLDMNGFDIHLDKGCNIKFLKEQL